MDYYGVFYEKREVCTIMNILLLITVVFALFLQSIASKQYLKKTQDQGAYIFNAVAILSAAIVFFLVDTDGFSFETKLIPYILGFALAYGSAMLFTFLSIKEGSLSFTNLVKSYSLIMPTFYGSLFLNEKIGMWFWFGFMFLVISIFLINMQKGEAKFGLKWIVYIAIAFFADGMAGVMQLTQQTHFEGQYKSEFMISSLVMVSVFFFVLSLRKEKAVISYCMKRACVPAIFMGIMNAVVNLFLMILVTRKMPTSITYPVMSGGVIVLTAVVSELFYKEKLSTMQRIGLACGVVSIVFMNL